MTTPRQLLRGSTYHVTRRCIGRRYLLKPTVLTTQVLGYLLARAAARSRVRVHAYCFMSNHYHLVVTDPCAALPAFMEALDSLISRAMNALYGRWGYFWEAGSYSATLLDSPSDILDACVYALANPVRAGLVRRSRQWPGLRSLPGEAGEVLTFERPNHFFSKNGQQPERIALHLAVPPGWETAAVFGAQLAEALAAREDELAAAGTHFAGLAYLRKLNPLGAPSTPEERRGLRPRFAAKAPGRLRALVERLAIFLAEHREAFLEWRSGNRDVRFPAGTYLMRVAHCASCVPGG